MKKAQVVVGGIYAARVSGNLVNLRVEEIIEHPERSGINFAGNHTVYAKACTRYRCTNLKTKREIMVRSAMRFRPSPIKPTSTYVPTDAEITKAINSR